MSDMPDPVRNRHQRMRLLLERIDKRAWEAINENCYAYGYTPGSRRFDQAKARARKAEQALMAALDELRALIPGDPA